jgi:hypothetical protein
MLMKFAKEKKKKDTNPYSIYEKVSPHLLPFAREIPMVLEVSNISSHRPGSGGMRSLQSQW